MRVLASFSRSLSARNPAQLAPSELALVSRALDAVDYWLIHPKTRSKKVATRRMSSLRQLRSSEEILRRSSPRLRFLDFLDFVGQTLPMTLPREAANRFVPALQGLLFLGALDQECLARLRREVGGWALGLSDEPRRRVEERD